MAKEYPVDPRNFDGAKFATRYGLTPRNPAQFYMRENDKAETVLVLADGVKIPDDPPIFDAPDDPATAAKKEAAAAARTEPYATIYATLASIITTEIKKAAPTYTPPTKDALKLALDQELTTAEAVNVGPLQSR
jgi:hypothetical protein